MINGQELKVCVYYNNLLLLCMAFMVSKAPFSRAVKEKIVHFGIEA